MSVPTRSADEVVQTLTAHLDDDAAKALVFDGDGTLWSGDVGEDLFEFAIERELLRDQASDALRGIAGRFGVVADGSPSAMAGAIFDAFRQGRFPELEVCEVMTWCYAGWAPAELAAAARGVMRARGIRERHQLELEPIFEWARGARVRTIVVSASPAAAVEAAVEPWGITPSDVAAARPEIVDDAIAPKMAAPIPYGPGKVDAATRLLGASRWVGAFGDNVFDMEMLAAATVPVAVRPKKALAGRLAELDGAVVLEPRVRRE